jgi:outer membrane protein OmpA-like peptidoglycan-associated protein
MKTARPVGTAILIAGACTVAGATRSTPAPSAIPLCPGLTIVTAVKQQNGDYESIKTIESVSATQVRIKYSAEGISGDWLDSNPSATKRVSLFRTVLAQDIRAASQYQQVYLENSAETIPGTTAIGVSTATLTALKTRGEADLSISSAYGGLNLTADADKRPNYYDYLSAGRIARVGKATVQVPLLVNDTPVSLPAIHAQGEIAGEKSEFHILDDEKNPLVLAFRLGIGAIAPLDPAMTEICDSLRNGGVSFSQVLGGERCQNPNGGDRDTLRVVKISYRCAAPPPSPPQGAGRDVPAAPGGTAPAGIAGALERALVERGRAEIYSIHFSFNSDRIREESEPTLKEIAGLLARHPEWKLSIEGHTDGIGGDGANLDLSRRRSAAVKAALVTRYKIDGNRLSTGGFGKSRPKDTNETLEGRARNRRVELVRQ